ncbi:MAG: translation initiation factor IF-2 [Campylobacterota bacterium]
MDKVRVYEVAKELGIDSKELVTKANDIGIEIKTASNAVSMAQAGDLMEYVMNGKVPKSAQKAVKTEKKEQKQEAKEPKNKSSEEASIIEKSSKIEAKPKKQEQAQSKDETPAPKDESETKSDESLAQSVQKKKKFKRGITIVKKKKKPQPAAQSEASKSSASDQSTQPKKIKPKKKKAPAKAKEAGQKLNMMEERDLSDHSTVFEEEEVVLLDFSDKNIVDEHHTKRKPSKPKKEMKNVRQAKPNAPRKSISRRRKSKKRPNRQDNKNQNISSISIPEDVRVYEFAESVGRSVGEVIKVLFGLGMMVTKNDFLDKDSIEVLAEEFDVEVHTVDPTDKLDYVSSYDENVDLESNGVTRPPVITIMGHVDHGKTSLLDRIRKAKVADKEAGGITQHVGAYQVEQDGKRITFIDTPGHEAFTEMRSRGAQATDIVVIVVAADDGVKPQTKEAISHAKAAGVPLIIAINKIDKPGANPEMAKSQLAEMEIVPADWGGDYEFVEVSAQTGEGIEDLLENINLQADLMELKAEEDVKAKATVVESSLEKGRGPVATVIVQNGTLNVGDMVVADTTYGRIKAIISDTGKQIKKLGPSDTGVIVGLNDVPGAGQVVIEMDDDKEAREIAQERYDYGRAKDLSKSTKATLDDLSNLIKEGELKALPVIIKADVQGSLEAIKGSLEKLKNEEVKVNIIHEGVGGITEGDLTLADASENAVILGFNVRPTGSIKKKAKEVGTQIKSYSVIYDLIDDVKALLSGMMSNIVSEEVTGQAEVRETFSVSKLGTIAGCMVTDGYVTRGGGARLIRDGVVVYETKISSLKRFNDDVKEVKKGFECGIMLHNFNDIKEGDTIETFKEVEEEATLE